MHPNHPQICNFHPFQTSGGCIILKSLFHWFHGSWPLESSLNFLFTLSWLYYAEVCWGLTLDVIYSHFDTVVKWPPRLTLASGLFWWVCLNISKYAPKPNANMQYPTFFYHWGVLQPCLIISDFWSASGIPRLPSPFIKIQCIISSKWTLNTEFNTILFSSKVFFIFLKSFIKQAHDA